MNELENVASTVWSGLQRPVSDTVAKAFFTMCEQLGVEIITVHDCPIVVRHSKPNVDTEIELPADRGLYFKEPVTLPPVGTVLPEVTFKFSVKEQLALISARFEQSEQVAEPSELSHPGE